MSLRYRLAHRGAPGPSAPGLGMPTTLAAFVGEDKLPVSVLRVMTVGHLAVTLRVHQRLRPVAGVSRRLLAETAQAVITDRTRAKPLRHISYRRRGTGTGPPPTR